MKLILPEGVSQRAFDAALKDMAKAVGEEWVLASDGDRETYLDHFAFDAPEDHAPSAAVAPASAEEVQAIVRVANEHGVPIWPISRGKNLAYGGSAPHMPGTVIVDLTRMNRILEVDEKLGYCLVEPGVGFFDLYEHLRANGIDLWMSVPGNSMGSVAGNALERGVGPQPYGEHASQICGLEVALPNGELMRTGTGAMTGGKTWNLARFGYGPAWDQIFCQSNYGIVTKLGLWLMPAPEATLTLRTWLNEPDDLGWAVDALRPLRMNRTIDHDVAFLSYIGLLALISQRDQWYQGEGAMPESVGAEIREKQGWGWWLFEIRHYGQEDVIEAQSRHVLKALEGRVKGDLAYAKWRRGEPIEKSAAGIPHTRSMQMVNWRGGRGGHTGFSPLLPADGAAALAQFHRTKARFEEFGVDYYGAFALGGRTITNVNEIIYNRDDPEMTANVRKLFDALIGDAAAEGYAEYRTHLSFMDRVAETFDFNDRALFRFNETVKDALDPNGILAPGRSGIWPRRYRGGQT